MKVIELLASQLDREVAPHELQATQHIFSTSIDFWMLCIEARRILAEEKLEKENDKDKP